MNTILKTIRIHGCSEKEIGETGLLLQEFLDNTAPADVRKLLFAAKNKPNLLKTAIKLS